MRTPLLVAATSCLALTIGTTSFAADTKPGTTAPKAAATEQMPSQVPADKLIGRNIQNAQNETIGEIESVMLGATGKAETVVVSVGGFLGVGEKEVALKWSDLNVSQNGEKVTVAMTKEQLKVLPEFKYRDDKQRGRVVPYDVGRADTAPMATPPARTAADTPAAPRTAPGASGPATRAPTASTAPAAGPVGTIGTATLVGVDVKNSAGENIGEIKDVVMDGSGKATSIMLGTGGVLGLGERTVPVGWDQIRIMSDDAGKLTASTTLTKEQIEAMPEYTKDKGAWRPK